MLEPQPLRHGTSNTSSLLTGIATATRQLHADLNRLILTRLPLALPPHSSNPDLYAIGLQHIAQIYFTFEQIWISHLEDASDPSLNPRLLEILETVYQPALLRTSRLASDLRTFQQASKHNNDTLLQASYDSPNLRAFATHIHSTTISKSHLLLAYVWIFYMALFNGGRYIRTQLHTAKKYYWSSHNLGPKNPADGEGRGELELSGLRFWHFSSPEATADSEDGADLKRNLRTAFEEAETLLTPSEKEEVIAETSLIFHRLALIIVEDLDKVAAAYRIEELRRTKAAENAFAVLLVKHLLPMGMVDLCQAFVKRMIWAAGRQQGAENSDAGKREADGVGEKASLAQKKAFFEARGTEGLIRSAAGTPHMLSVGNLSGGEISVRSEMGSLESRPGFEVVERWKDGKRRRMVSTRL